MEKLNSQITSYEHNQQPILTEHPTITFYDFISKSGNPLSITSMKGGIYYFYENGNKAILLKEGENVLNATTKECIYLETIVTLQGNAFKITPYLSFVKKGDTHTIFVTGAASKSTSMKVSFTTEGNAYGALFQQWMDGKVFGTNIEVGTYVRITDLRPEKYIFLNKTTSQCSYESFYECAGSNFVKYANFSDCPRQCLPVSYPNIDPSKVIPSCDLLSEEWRCASKKAHNHFLHLSTCSKSCSVIQYHGNIEVYPGYPQAYLFDYTFAPQSNMTINKEFMVYDTISMISAVAGTFGLFIGFSFINVITSLIDYLHKFFKYWNRWNTTLQSKNTEFRTMFPVNIFDKAMLLVLWSFSIYYTWEVLDQFSLQTTSFGNVKHPITEQPAITICLNNQHFHYGLSDIWLNYWRNKKNDKINLKKGRNFLNGTTVKEQIYLNEMMTGYLYEDCFKITSELEFVLGDKIYIAMGIYDKKHVVPSIKVYITSEKNAYGAIFGQWIEGEPFLVNIKNGTRGEIIIRPEKYVYLEKTSHCSTDKSFYDEVSSHFVSTTNFSGCPRKCLPVSYPNNGEFKIPFCKTHDKNHNDQNLTGEWRCAARRANSHFKNSVEKFKKSCNILKYHGTPDGIFKDKSINANEYEFSYNFASQKSVKVYKEYLVYDGIGMIGSIGGTVGMFVGLSFLDAITYLIKYLQNLRN